MWWRSLPVSFDGSGPSDPNVVNTEEERAMVRSHSRSRRPLGSVALGMSAVLAWYSCGGEPRDVTAPESRSPSVSLQIGRASCRERVERWVGAVTLKKKNKRDGACTYHRK